jgi:DNA-directed RNA polymerase subunit RPC12/RpoP
LVSEVIEYRCLDCGKRYPYGELARERLDTCPVCGYELVPVSEAEMDDSYRPRAVTSAIGLSPSTPRLIGVFVGVSGLIFALALWLPK